MNVCKKFNAVHHGFSESYGVTDWHPDIAIHRAMLLMWHKTTLSQAADTVFIIVSVELFTDT